MHNVNCLDKRYIFLYNYASVNFKLIVNECKYKNLQI